MHGLFESYYAGLHRRTHLRYQPHLVRGMPALRPALPEAKVIACVRDLPWVIDIERLVTQRNVFSPSSIFNCSPGGTIYTRASQVSGQDGMVGGS